MARDSEKISSKAVEDRVARVAESACKKEACAIQACLQGINIFYSSPLAVNSSDYSKSCTSKKWVYATCDCVPLAHNYQEKSCVQRIEALQKCCEQLSPLIFKSSSFCEGMHK